MKRNRTQVTHRRAGTAMIVAVVCLTLLAAITVSLVRLAVASQHQVEREGWRLQSAWLAESALNRAIARIDRGENWDSDEWTPTGIGPVNSSGRTTTTLAPDPDNESHWTITVVADFPDHPTDRVRTTRSRTVSRTNNGNETAEDSE
ncbi:MAG: hypothetical protein KDA93_08945 [Planctomycetaceae bacterium]|nr:hypothetical protein [Planctomycetaceae bacterium]